MRRVWLPPVACAATAFGIFFGAMAYPWQLALLSATAIGALVYSTQVTWRRMRRLMAPAGGEPLLLSAGAGGEDRGPGAGRASVAGVGVPSRRQIAPGKEHQGENEQQVDAAAQDESRHQQDHPTREQRTGQQQAESR